MAEKQILVTEILETGTPTLSAPPSLQLIQTDAAAGLCVDGYCVLPSAKSSQPND